ncbi:MAG: hypothetical protein HYV16_13415 [Gammaproteobacteria bacterium]|nr:hypothetical protein [Gammaproteobacteria bacterium]
MSATLRLRAALVALFLLAYLGLQALALAHEYEGKQHAAGEVCGLCLASAQLDKPLSHAQPPLALGNQTAGPFLAPAPSAALAARYFHPARAPPANT